MAAVASTAVVFSLSLAPSTALHFFFLTPSGKNVSDNVFVDLYRITFFLSTLNIMSNFYVYSLTIPSFRKFIQSTMFFRKLFPSISPQQSTPDLGDSRYQSERTIEITGL